MKPSRHEVHDSASRKPSLPFQHASWTKAARCPLTHMIRFANTPFGIGFPHEISAAQEIPDQSQACILTFLGVKLTGQNISFFDTGGEFFTCIVGH